MKIPVKASGDKAVDEPIPCRREGVQDDLCVHGQSSCSDFIGCDVREFPLEEIGPKFENHERFPNRVNTEFVRVIDRPNGRDACVGKRIG